MPENDCFGQRFKGLRRTNFQFLISIKFLINEFSNRELANVLLFKNPPIKKLRIKTLKIE